MTWQELYKKYKDTELMKEFAEFIYKELGYKKDRARFFLSETGWGIKDIYGYLFCFAKSEYDYDLEKTIIGSLDVGTPEKLMLYRTNKFFESDFEVAK